MVEKINPFGVRQADLIIGIPSYNEADNIAFVVQKCNEGLQQYFPQLNSVIINVDNNSPDDTRAAFLNAPSQVPKMYISTPEGVKGKGNNFYNLFTEAVRLGARGIVVVDADLRSITGEWIRDLAQPILEHGFDFVTPLYSRNEYDGTITNTICYPIIYGLLGKEIRQPIGGEFACSAALVHHYLSQPWHKTTRQYGIDIFMTLNALIGGFKVCQVGLGAKIHKPSAPKLGPMFTQVVGTLFKTLLECRGAWQNVQSVEQLPLFGASTLAKPQSLSVDYKGMKSTAMYEFSINEEILKQCLTPRVYEKVAAMYHSGRIQIGVDLWTRIVYDLLHAYDSTDANSDLIEAMKSLYFGRVISFIRQTLDMNHEESEQQIQRQARHFFKMRSYLLRKYRQKQVA
ncbi:MAG: glycosyltransferase [Calditrichaeota bacterium]|nr:MAG: glycosyltransferase [Calditrichota bacterium]